MDKADEDDTNSNYVVGYVSSKMPRVFCKDKQNTFNTICVPYMEDVLYNRQQIKQNQHVHY